MKSQEVSLKSDVLNTAEGDQKNCCFKAIVHYLYGNSYERPSLSALIAHPAQGRQAVASKQQPSKQFESHTN